MSQLLFYMLVLTELIGHHYSSAFQNVDGRRVTTTTAPTTTSISALQEASFGTGCFWAPSQSFLTVDGVKDTVAGYAFFSSGGSSPDNKPPSYEKVCYGNDWVEAVRVIYDDKKVSYYDLLEAMFEISEAQLGSTQYASVIFPHCEEQSKIAHSWMEANKEKQRSDGWRAEWTVVQPLSKFYKAEGYHQRYWQKQRPRFAAIGFLLALSVGILDSVIPEAFQDTVENVANGSIVAIGLFTTMERFIDSKVVEM